MSDAWVFHRGSLGDSILVWPILRALRASGRNVTLVSDASRAALAAAELGVVGVSAEQPRFNAMWQTEPGARATGHAAEGNPSLALGALILSFLADPASAAGRTWLGNAARMFPGAEVIAEPRRVDRVVALEYAARFGGPPPVAVRRNPGGPVVVHVGAGGGDKRLPMEWWLTRTGDATVRERERAPSESERAPSESERAPSESERAPSVSERDSRSPRRTLPHGRVSYALPHGRVSYALPRGRVSYIAGEVERERFTARDRELFAGAGGRYLDDLPTLAATLRAARLYVGADTGPTHLAAALGVPTVALFGPTDPARWAPIGPRVRIKALGPES